VSSSGLRERVAKGQPLDILVPPAVIDRIRELRLYGLAA
jgi:nicotinic acid mononucleotide adenylyltransferase